MNPGILEVVENKVIPKLLAIRVGKLLVTVDRGIAIPR